MIIEDKSPNAGAPPYLDLEPRLPPEIEHEILVQAFQISTINSRMNLLLVSKRAFTWINPLIYRVVVMNFQGSYVPPLSSLRKYGTHVVHMRLIGSFSSDPSSTGFPALLLCPNVTNFVMWSTLSSRSIPRLFELRGLKRLLFHHPGSLEDDLIDLHRQLEKDQRSGHGHDRIGGDPILISRQKWCENITHLAWGTISSDETRLPLFTLFPNLTHFLIGGWNSSNVVLEILRFCPRLEVFIWLLANFDSSDATFVIEPSVKGKSLDLGDIRIVTIEGDLINDWVRGTKGGDDMWVIAERKVEERRKLQISASVGNRSDNDVDVF
ncbi:hypothetical protein BDN72DRAFT_965408, partial [Pluteus cervinus]